MMRHQVFVSLDYHNLRVEPLLVSDEYLILAKALALCLILDLIKIVRILTLLRHHIELLSL